MATPDPTPVPLTDDPRINGLMEPSNWVSSGSLTLTWSAHNSGGASGGTWSAGELPAVQAAFKAWSNVANITFTRVSGPGDFKQTNADLAVVASGTRLQEFDEAIGLAFTPDPDFNEFDLMGEHYTAANYPRSQGDIFLDDSESGNFARGGSGFATMLHEIGHALGFKHPHDTPRTFGQLEIGFMDNVSYTVMSYRHPDGPSQALTVGWPVTPMPIDILAIQYIYGANMSYKAGNDSYFLDEDTGLLMTLWDAGGTDLLDATRVAFGMTLSLEPGAFNHHGDDSMTAIAYNVTIENARGTNYSDQITGNSADNEIDARSGDDRTVGGGGADQLLGGNGNDMLNGGTGADTLTGGGGHDSLIGGEGHDNIDGGSGNDTLRGGAGNDSLRGGSGHDQLQGEGGDDSLDGNSGNDVLNGGPGKDTFRFSSPTTPGNADTVADFQGAGATVIDTIELENAVFGVLTAGTLSADSFVSGTNPVAADADDFILYNTTSGALFYDADGNGAGAAVQFALLTGSPNALDAADFVVT